MGTTLMYFLLVLAVIGFVVCILLPFIFTGALFVFGIVAGVVAIIVKGFKCIIDLFRR